MRPPLLLLSLFCRPPAAAFGQFPFEWDFSIFHRINILSRSLSFTPALSLSLSLFLCLYSCVFVRFVFVVLVVVVGALPITKCLLCLVRVAPPFFFCFFSFFYVTPHLAFRNVELTFAHKKRETYNVEHVLLRFGFFWARFSPKRKKKKKQKISPVKVAKRQSFPFQFSVSLCHCVSSIILTCTTFYVLCLFSIFHVSLFILLPSLSLLYR